MDAMARQKLDRRSVLLSFSVALVAAIAAGWIATVVLSDDTDRNGGSETLELTDAASIDVDRLLALPLESSEGEPTSLAQLGAGDGKRTLVNFWQSSCAPCIDEMPMLEEAAQANPDVGFIGVATQDPPDKANELAEQTGITYPWALDPEARLFNTAQAAGMPTTLLLDADGTVLTSKTGAFSSADELDEFLGVGA
jgi:thiol-disulfide isomerase/thioredoxin